uniref:Rbbp6_0 protein n=1 Tax=Fopius arisanus TaxID=64838 RepID=A0A0C9RHS3_9HYME
MSVHYKFKSTKDFDTVSFDGLHISIADLKKAIFHQKRLGKNTDFDLQITNAQTKEDYTDDNALIAKNTSLIIARIPLTVQQKRSWDRNEPQSFSNAKDESGMGHTVDLTRLDGSEEDKIRAMMTQSTQDYDPSNYMKIRGANQTGEVPPNYRCYKCHQPGHWIKNCPLGATQEPIEIKKSTGIPRSFMVPVEGPLVPGAMMTPTGHYAVPAIDHQAYKEGKKERPPFFQDPEPAAEKPEIPEDLICSICKDLLTDAVMVPCCGNSYCDECIRSSLLESEEHECPGCNEKDVSPETLIPNRYLRGNVLQFNNKTGYAKKTPYPPSVKPLAPVVDNEKTEVIQRESLQEPPKESLHTEDPPPGTLDEKESTPVREIPEHVVPPVADEDSEVVPPPPPGTEPLLPIPSASKSPEKESDSTEVHCSERREHEDDYGGDYGGDYDDYEEDRRSRDRHRSYSKEGIRDRTGDGGRRIENIRSMNRRRSLSPRQRQDYQTHGTPLPHMMNQSKGYQNMPTGNQRYSSMHYDSQLRRSTEDRPGTPTVDEPHLHSQTSVNQAPLLPYPPGEECIPPPPPQNYNQPPPRMAPHNPPLLPDPYMGHRMPMYPHQQGPHYGPPRYDRPPYQQTGYRSSQPPRNYNGPPRPIRGMHHRGYRGMQPPPPGLGRNMHNGNPPGVIDDPLEAFERMLREKDERDRRLGKHRRRSRTRSRSRSYTRSRSRSFSRRSPLPSRMSRSRSPPPKRRPSRSPPPRRSRTPKRRSRSGSFSISRSRSYSRSQSPRGSISRDRERERERDRDRERDLPPRYRSPVRSPPRFQRDRERDRDRGRSREPPRESREQYSSYYNDSSANEYGFRERERDISNRERGPRYPPRNQTTPHNIPPLLSHAMPPMSMGATQQPERKDYYDSYNRYFRINCIMFRVFINCALNLTYEYHTLVYFLIILDIRLIHIKRSLRLMISCDKIQNVC